MDINRQILVNSFLSRQEKIVLLILSTQSCRISEILSAVWSNFYPGRVLILKATKHSRDVIVRDREILSMIDQLPHIHPEKIFWPIDYQRMYRLVKRNYSHIFLRYRGRKNYKVCHGFRYTSIDGIADRQAAQEILHHRREKTQDYYRHFPDPKKK
jgi:integrase